MIRVIRNRRMIAMLLSTVFILGTLGSLSVGAQGRYYRDYNHRHRHDKHKSALIIGTRGRTGYVVVRHGNHWRHRRDFRRY